ncbi:MAG: GtrA family protein [Desulfovibrio sp.]|nr:GtrA family protein [Desulfovibrio sp.]
MLKRIIHFIRYGIASSVSLAIDYCSYLIMLKLDIFSIPVAASLSYTVGLFFAYILMVKKVFTDKFARHGRKKELVLFICSGLIGITITYIVSNLVIMLLGESYNLPKLSSVVVSFFSVYWFRCTIVFYNKKYNEG